MIVTGIYPVGIYTEWHHGFLRLVHGKYRHNLYTLSVDLIGDFEAQDTYWVSVRINNAINFLSLILCINDKCYDTL